MNLIYQDLKIRKATNHDCQQLLKWWNDGCVMAHVGFPYGLHTSEEKIRQQLSQDDSTHEHLIIEYQNKAIGEMVYIKNDDQKVEIHIKICETSYQEKGLGRIALSMLIEELFQLGYQKIILDTDFENKRAQHVYELLGFKKIKVNYDSWTNQIGELRSSVDYELIKKDFRNYKYDYKIRI
ncbi:MAG: GNAT family N-acetyltransferase [Traorella sp.]